MHSDFQRHIDACNNAVLPGRRLPLMIGADVVGYVTPTFAVELRAFAGFAVNAETVVVTDPAVLPEVARVLSVSPRGVRCAGAAGWGGADDD